MQNHNPESALIHSFSEFDSAPLAPAVSQPIAPSARIDVLINACWTDVFEAFGVAGRGCGLPRRLLRCLLAARIQGLAQQMQAYDALVETCGLQRGAAYALQCLARPVVSQGHVPAQGPLLLVSNHPGLADSIALFAQLPRTDLRVIAAHQALLAALPATARHLFFVAGSGVGHLTPARQAVRHMNDGGTVLTYPGGRIEPDPAVRAGAAAALSHWSYSVDLFARRVPNLTIVPVMVSGVLAETALCHPLTRLRRRPSDREWLAATLQMLRPALDNGGVTNVAFGSAIHPAKLPRGVSARAAVLTEARRLLEPGG